MANKTRVSVNLGRISGVKRSQIEEIALLKLSPYGIRSKKDFGLVEEKNTFTLVFELDNRSLQSFRNDHKQKSEIWFQDPINYKLIFESVKTAAQPSNKTAVQTGTKKNALVPYVPPASNKKADNKASGDDVFYATAEPINTGGQRNDSYQRNVHFRYVRVSVRPEESRTSPTNSNTSTASSTISASKEDKKEEKKKESTTVAVPSIPGWFKNLIGFAVVLFLVWALVKGLEGWHPTTFAPPQQSAETTNVPVQRGLVHNECTDRSTSAFKAIDADNKVFVGKVPVNKQPMLLQGIPALEDGDRIQIHVSDFVDNYKSTVVQFTSSGVRGSLISSETMDANYFKMGDPVKQAVIPDRIREEVSTTAQIQMQLNTLEERSLPGCQYADVQVTLLGK